MSDDMVGDYGMRWEPGPGVARTLPGAGERCAMEGEKTALFEASLRGYLAMVDSRTDAARAELADWEALGHAARRVLRGTRAVTVGVPEEVTMEELNRCATMGAGLEMIAEKSGGRIRLGEAVKLIHQSALTSATLPSVRTALHRYIKASPDWIQESRGVYRRVGFAGGEKWYPGGLVRVHHADGSEAVYRVRVGPNGDLELEDVDGNVVGD